jgi:hypothetical protein
MFSVCVCACVFLCLYTGREALRRADHLSKESYRVPDQETEKTQPYAPKAGARSQVWEQRGRKRNHCKIDTTERKMALSYSDVQADGLINPASTLLREFCEETIACVCFRCVHYTHLCEKLLVSSVIQFIYVLTSRQCNEHVTH